MQNASTDATTAAGAEEALGRTRSRAPLLIALFFAAALIPLLATPVLPVIDLYNHLARFFVLSHIGTSPVLQQNYEVTWQLLPNIGLDVLMTGVMQVLPQAMAAHFTVLLIFAVQFGGILYFNRALTGRLSPMVALLMLPLLYSFILVWGFASFLLGLGLVFWAAGWWLEQRHRLALALPVACLLAALIYFVHGLAFALYGVTVGMIEIGIFWQSPQPRRLLTLVKALLPVLVQAVVPTLLFLAAPTSRIPGGATVVGTKIAKLAQTGGLDDRLRAIFEYRLITIARVAEGPSLAFDAVSLLIVAMIGIMLMRRGYLAIDRRVLPALAVAALLVCITPPALFHVGSVADRMPLFMAMLLVGALRFRPGGGALVQLCFAGLGMIIALRLVLLTIGWSAYAGDDADFRAVAAKLPADKLVVAIVAHPARLEAEHRRCEMYGPRLIAEHRAIGGIFAEAGKQPVQLIGPLRAALSTMSFDNWRAPGFQDMLLAGAGRHGFDYALICDPEDLTRPLPAGASVIARQGRFLLLQYGR